MFEGRAQKTLIIPQDLRKSRLLHRELTKQRIPSAVFLYLFSFKSDQFHLGGLGVTTPHIKLVKFLLRL